MKVPLLDLKAQFSTIKDEVMAAVAKVFDDQQFINGPEVKILEEKIAEYCQCKKAIGVSSGTDALLCALMALDIGPGDEVITTPFTFFATAGCIWRAGAKPVFVDIDPKTYNIDPSQIEGLINEDTKAVMPVHLFGQAADMDAINEIANDYEPVIPVIEDACQSIGAAYKGKRAGSLGAIGCFSFFPSKNLGCAGDGGIITTNDEELGEKMAMIRMHGSKPKYYHSIVGGNFRLDTLQAAVLIVKLKHLDRWSEKRRENAAKYKKLLADIELIALPFIEEHNVSVVNQFIIRVQKRDELRKYLADKEIGTEIYYPLSLHEQECFKTLGYKKGGFPESEKAAAETVALPIYPELSDDQINYVAETIRDFCKQ
jgi:dTDP-4-amino-4,6-dideoxygalactose transaminase